MEWFWIAAPFFVFISIGLMAFRKYKNKGKAEEFKEPSLLQRQSFYPYLSLFFFHKTEYRKSSTNIFYWIAGFFNTVFLMALFLYFQRPAVPLQELEVVEGQVISVVVYKKSPEKIEILKKDKNIVEIYANISKETKKAILDKDVKIWYFSRLFEEAAIYQLYINNEPYKASNNNLWKYDYKEQKEKQKLILNFVVGSFFVWILNIFILLILNNQELKNIKLNKKCHK